MSYRFLRSLLVTVSFFVPFALSAQNAPATRPTPAQAQALLQNRPDLVAQLRQRFATTGLSKEQVHARLKAEGYPEDLLDAYLPGAVGDAAAPNEDVFRAVRALGVVDDSSLMVLRGLGVGNPSDTLASLRRQALAKDTI